MKFQFSQKWTPHLYLQNCEERETVLWPRVKVGHLALTLLLYQRLTASVGSKSVMLGLCRMIRIKSVTTVEERRDLQSFSTLFISLKPCSRSTVATGIVSSKSVSNSKLLHVSLHSLCMSGHVCRPVWQSLILLDRMEFRITHSSNKRVASAPACLRGTMKSLDAALII